jgi:hypothetical protein
MCQVLWSERERAERAQKVAHVTAEILDQLFNLLICFSTAPHQTASAYK